MLPDLNRSQLVVLLALILGALGLGGELDITGDDGTTICVDVDTGIEIECNPAPTTTTTSTTQPPTTTTTTVAPTTTTTSIPPTTTSIPDDTDIFWTEDFATAESMERFEFHVWHRNPDDGAESWPGDHADNADGTCGGPETTRTILRDFPEQSWYWCPLGTGHVMSSIGHVGGYSIGSMTPTQTFTDVSVVRWDVNMTDLGARQWTEVKIIPAEYFHPEHLPCSIGLPCGTQLDAPFEVPFDLGEDALDFREIGAVGTQWNGLRAMVINTQDEVYTDGSGDRFRCLNCEGYVPGERFHPDYGYGAGDPALTSRAIRLSNEFRDNRDGTITWALTLSNGEIHELTVPGSFPTGEVRVVFADHNYTPLKSPSTLLEETWFTWHWDSIVIG